MGRKKIGISYDISTNFNFGNDKKLTLLCTNKIEKNIKLKVKIRVKILKFKLKLHLKNRSAD